MPGRSIDAASLAVRRRRRGAAVAVDQVRARRRDAWRCSRCGALRDRRADAAAVGAALAVAAGVYVVAHSVIYGGWTAYATGDYFARPVEFTVVGTTPNYLGRSRRLVGLLVDDGFGIGGVDDRLAGAAARARRRCSDADLATGQILVLPLAAGWLTATFVASTMHGWWWPGRQLVVVLPLAVIVIAIAAERSRAACAAYRRRRRGRSARHVAVDDDRGDHPSACARRRLRPRRRIRGCACGVSCLPDGQHPTAPTTLLTVVWIAVVLALFVVGLAPGRRCRALSAHAGRSKVPLTLSIINVRSRVARHSYHVERSRREQKKILGSVIAVGFAMSACSQ